MHLINLSDVHRILKINEIKIDMTALIVHSRNTLHKETLRIMDMIKIKKTASIFMVCNTYNGNDICEEFFANVYPMVFEEVSLFVCFFFVFSPSLALY